MARLPPHGLLPKEARLHDVGAAVFRTKDVAVAAVVAEINEVADLVTSLELQGLASFHGADLIIDDAQLFLLSG